MMTEMEMHMSAGKLERLAQERAMLPPPRQFGWWEHETFGIDPLWRAACNEVAALSGERLPTLDDWHGLDRWTGKNCPPSPHHGQSDRELLADILSKKSDRELIDDILAQLL